MTQATPTVPMTLAEAQLWLAGLEKPCPCASIPQHDENCVNCHGSGKVPVLPGLRGACTYVQDAHSFLRDQHTADCPRCKGQNWLPEGGRDLLHQGMNKAGWDVEIHQGADGARLVKFFWKRAPIVIGNHSVFPDGGDADDHLAAVEALKAAGYG